MSEAVPRGKLTIRDLQRMRERSEPIAVATAYDYVTTKLIEAAGIEVALVSDWGIATTLLGYRMSSQVTWDEALFYLTGVCRIAESAWIVGSLPFGSYQVSDGQAVRNAAKIMKAGADAVMLEGLACSVDRVRSISRSGIICVVYLGATPHYRRIMGGRSSLGQTAEEAAQLVREAQELEEAGASVLILEGIPHRVAVTIGQRTDLVTVGSGGTRGCDGQLLTTHSVLGMPEAMSPMLLRTYADFESRMLTALDEWCSEVRSSDFPTSKQTFSIKDDEFERFMGMIQ